MCLYMLSIRVKNCLKEHKSNIHEYKITQVEMKIPTTLKIIYPSMRIH